jgi:hypothetical protein
MTRRSRSICLVFAPGAVVLAAAIGGCFQEIDVEAASGKGIAPPQVDGGTASPKGPQAQVGPCPSGEVCSSPGSVQCTLDSPECFFLCGAPLCSLGPDPNDPDAGVTFPQAATVPPILVGNTDSELFADGSTTTNPCAQVEAESLFIRQRSCAPCHNGQPPGPSQGEGNFNSIMNDSLLVTTHSATGIMTDGGALAQYVVPGDPNSSLVFETVTGGSMPPSPSLSENLIGYEAGAGIVPLTPADVSILYAWILACVPGTDAGVYAAMYGGGLGGTQCFGPCGDASTE